MNPAELRALAQAVLDTQGADYACRAYHQHLTGMHPADVLALLDENARLYRALKRWQFVDCPQCGGDCEGAGVADCIMQETRTALSGGAP